MCVRAIETRTNSKKSGNMCKCVYDKCVQEVLVHASMQNFANTENAL